MRIKAATLLDDEKQCRQVVLDFCTDLNEWEAMHTAIMRIANGQIVSDARRRAIAEQITEESHLLEHTIIFQRFVVPRDRKYGSNPGQPNSWGQSFFDVSPDSIESVDFLQKNRAEVIASWGFMMPSGQIMFVVKRKSGKWLIDSLKTRQDNSDSWLAMHF